MNRKTCWLICLLSICTLFLAPACGGNNDDGDSGGDEPEYESCFDCCQDKDKPTIVTQCRDDGLCRCAGQSEQEAMCPGLCGDDSSDAGNGEDAESSSKSPDERCAECCEEKTECSGGSCTNLGTGTETCSCGGCGSAPCEGACY